jgi:putative lipoprotein
MRFRLPLLAVALVAMSGCSWLPHHHAAQRDAASSTPAPPVHQSLMKSMVGDVRYELPQALPADAYLLITLADVSKQDAPARTVAEERIQPVGASPVDFLLAYDPADLRDGVDFAINVRLQQGDKLLAINDARVSVLGRSGENGPVSVVLKAVP